MRPLADIKVTVAITCALTVLATLIYMGGIRKNLPYAPEIDEPIFVVRAASMATESYLDPKWFGNPASTTIYPLAALYRTLYGTNATALLQSDPAALYLPGRIVSILYGVGTVILVFLSGRRVVGDRAAVAGTLFFIVSTLVVYHYQVVRSDSAAAFFGWASLYQLSRLYDRPNLKNTLLTGALIGLAISSRYFMVTFLFPLALVAWLRLRPANGTRAALMAIVLGGLVALLAFAFTTPFFFLDFHTAWADVANEARSTHLGADGLTPPQNVLYYVFSALPSAITWPQTIAAAAGLILAFLRRQTLALVLAATAFVFIGAISLSPLHWARWIIQILPIFTLLAGFALTEIVDRSTRRVGLKRALFALGLLALTGVPMYRVVLHDIRESRPSTRVAARVWFLENAEPGSSILQEWYGALLVDTPFEVREQFSLADRDDPCSYQAEGVDYLVASSSIFDRYYREPERYADEIAFYENLRAGPYQVDKESPSDTIGGPTIKIYDIRSCMTP